MEAENYNGVNTDGWWMSEKYDGVYAFWDSTKLLTKNDNIIILPDSFKLPQGVVLCGEMYLGRGNFEATGIFRKLKPIESEWQNVTFNVFDLPMHPGPFEERMEALEKLVTEFGSLKVKFVKQIKITSKEHRDSFYNEIISNGGEGIMLRKPGSLYEFNRSTAIMKMKPLSDAEAEIIGYTEGNGRNAQRLGAFKVKGVNGPMKGLEFKLSGMTDAVRNSYRETHPIGTIVTYAYNDTTKNGKPRFPRYLRIRNIT